MGNFDADKLLEEVLAALMVHHGNTAKFPYFNHVIVMNNFIVCNNMQMNSVRTAGYFELVWIIYDAFEPLWLL